MAENSGQEKTEKATGKRREEARRRGQVASSREVPSTLILITGLAVMQFAGAFVFERLRGILGGIFRDIHTIRLDSVAVASAMALELFKNIVLILLPFFIPILVAGFIGNVGQFGLAFHATPLAPKFGNLNPLSGIKKLFSLRSTVEMLKSVLKLLLVGAIAYAVIVGSLEDFPGLVALDLASIAALTWQVGARITLYVCLALVVLSALDVVYQRWQYEQNLKMTKQEVKDEHKSMEGDPQVKARIRSLQRQAAYQRMMVEVPKSDVVITNPTHLAIALSYDAQQMAAPRVVAKGADFVAERIKEVAREHDVPLVENKPLAQALFKMADVGDPIPVDLYRAVAEVLAYVYKLKGRYAV
jgi:flagellar biosynthetic protein FlhB